MRNDQSQDYTNFMSGNSGKKSDEIYVDALERPLRTTCYLRRLTESDWVEGVGKWTTGTREQNVFKVRKQILAVMANR